MPRSPLNGIEIFLTIVREGSLRAAALRLELLRLFIDFLAWGR